MTVRSGLVEFSALMTLATEALYWRTRMERVCHGEFGGLEDPEDPDADPFAPEYVERTIRLFAQDEPMFGGVVFTVPEINEIISRVKARIIK
jgi:hypothetical protein